MDCWRREGETRVSGTRLEATAASAAWAAWGDALGFVTELTDSSGLRHRAGLERVVVPVPWRRRIGGRAGATVRFGAGTYSDDTQLRLATSRCIRGDGLFDVDTFSRVELVAWQSYHLGAGRGSKAAAAAMARSGARWTQNTFSGRGPRYVDVGGNGAAMRIQPHVWAAKDLNDPIPLLRSVLRDAVCTHGHPVGLVGAAFHAVTLARTMLDGAAPEPAQWGELVNSLRVLPEVIASDDELGGLWLPAWEQAAGREFPPALRETVQELSDLVGSVSAELDSPRAAAEDAYIQVLRSMGGFDDATRGSGIGTAVAALYLAAVAEDPVETLGWAANALGSDTDTIATMAGALIGAVLGTPPESPAQDHKYLMDEAARLHTIARGASAPSYSYPDLLRWNPPRTALDLIGTDPSGQVSLAGLGPVASLDAPVRSARAGVVYQWGGLRTGQRVLLRHREVLNPLPATLLAPPRRWEEETRIEITTQIEQATLFGDSRRNELQLSEERTPKHRAGTTSAGEGQPLDVERALARVRAADYDAETIGLTLLEVIQTNPQRCAEHASTFAAAIARDIARRA